MITNEQEAAGAAYYNRPEKPDAMHDSADEITVLKARIALLEAKINTTKKIIKHCQPVEPSYANEELVDALTAINKCLQ